MTVSEKLAEVLGTAEHRFLINPDDGLWVDRHEYDLFEPISHKIASLVLQFGENPIGGYCQVKDSQLTFLDRKPIIAKMPTQEEFNFALGRGLNIYDIDPETHENRRIERL